MFRIAVILLASSIPAAAGAQQVVTPADYVESLVRELGADHTLREASVKTPEGRLLVGLVLPPLSTETLESKAVLFIAKVNTVGAIQESAKSQPFPFYAAGGKYYVEHIEATSPRRFSIQFNQRAGACGGGYEIYRFAVVAGIWRVSGRDVTEYQCREPEEGLGDSRTEWSANFLTGRVLVRAFQHDKMVSSKLHRRTFPVFSLERFDPSDARYGLR